MLMKPYTRTGDKGETSLFAQRVKKTDNRIACIGSIDETAAAISVARTELEDIEMTEILLKIERTLSKIAGIIAGSTDTLQEDDVKRIEEWTDKYYIEKQGFERPKTEAGALLDLARTICRRAEISTIKTEAQETILKYMNRLSDLLFAMRTFCDEK
ncbi:MAG TPA: cob(I)yrinic acid a,c-diamide adenosyltransferase [Candidatus Woesearchaeota archaeon]|nr:MAG: cob(I)yrinic acid a,c-diamide adenosyltransferase [Candidatus Woesearchaeota archaeon]HDD70544.1 cob(I)yrinic acid a,c-diamide adenosyltransferase [Candidatus Woesearchaeota archaeon]